jgi:hypothetical protein
LVLVWFKFGLGLVCLDCVAYFESRLCLVLMSLRQVLVWFSLALRILLGTGACGVAQFIIHQFIIHTLICPSIHPYTHTHTHTHTHTYVHMHTYIHTGLKDSLGEREGAGRVRRVMRRCGGKGRCSRALFRRSLFLCSTFGGLLCVCVCVCVCVCLCMCARCCECM